jgi:hypothetical protein
MEMIPAYEAALKSHDWYYSMSDDGRYYRKGLAESVAIAELKIKLHAAGLGELADELYLKYMPK